MLFKKNCFNCHYCSKTSNTRFTFILTDEERKSLKRNDIDFLSGSEQKIWSLTCYKNRWSEGRGGKNSSIKDVLRIRSKFKCNSFHKFNPLIESFEAVDDELKILNQNSAKCFAIISATCAIISIMASINK